MREDIVLDALRDRTTLVGMPYRDARDQLLTRLLELEARLDALGSRVEALEATARRLEVNLVAGSPGRPDPGEGSLSQALAVNEVRDRHVAEQVGSLALRVSALEQRLSVEPRRARVDDDIRALVDDELTARRR